ncbi:diaminopimelate decarboxylase [Massilia sp. W12]|uniref:diaminopimelate decarboxylase n=1 Tax=Massilia sp. W12 TaxID=3126507 RepID=UPI0030D2BD81
MSHFSYQSGQLMLEGVSADALAARYGSPLYVYSQQALLDNLAQLRSAFSALSPLLCFSIKSCPNLSILRLLGQHGAGMDVVSGGELQRALRAGVAAEKIVFAGVGKSAQELQFALQAGVFLFNVESEGELERLDALAASMQVQAQVALRINPDVADAATPDKTATGGRQTKFGIPLLQARQLALRPWKASKVCGLHVHLGSPIASVETYLQALDRLELLERDLHKAGRQIEFINLGGGFPVSYGKAGEQHDSVQKIGAILSARLQAWRAAGKHFLLEPGRAIAANAGVLLSRVEYVKQGWEQRIAIMDAGMHTLLRPTLYEAWHSMWPTRDPQAQGDWLQVCGAARADLQPLDVVGPICETGDYLALGRPLPNLQQGGLLAVFSCGAYGMSMASQYNSRGRPAEVLVHGTQHRLIRQAEVQQDLVRHELACLDQAFSQDSL